MTVAANMITAAIYSLVPSAFPPIVLVIMEGKRAREVISIQVVIFIGVRPTK